MEIFIYKIFYKRRRDVTESKEFKKKNKEKIREWKCNLRKVLTSRQGKFSLCRFRLIFKVLVPVPNVYHLKWRYTVPPLNRESTLRKKPNQSKGSSVSKREGDRPVFRSTTVKLSLLSLTPEWEIICLKVNFGGIKGIRYNWQEDDTDWQGIRSIDRLEVIFRLTTYRTRSPPSLVQTNQ